MGSYLVEFASPPGEIADTLWEGASPLGCLEGSQCCRAHMTSAKVSKTG